MKRTSNCFEKITDLKNLHSAFYKASRHKRLTAEYLYFRQNASENLAKLRSALVGGHYKMLPYKQFLVHDPKERVISAAHFSDRIVHHAIMNILEPVLEKLKPKGFVRYMDDMVLFADDIALLKNASEQLSYYTEDKLKCCLKPPIFGRTRDGVPFLGWRITDKRIFLLRKSKKRSAKTILRINNLACSGLISENEAVLRIQTVMAVRRCKVKI